MKKLAIILSLILVSQAAYAGGTVLYMQGETPQNTQDVSNVTPSDDNSNGKKKGKTTRRVRFGAQQNNPYTYWNYGAVNFGSGFSSTGSGVKRY